MSLHSEAIERPQAERVVPEVIPRELTPEVQRIAFRDNPIPRAEDLRFITENSRIHRKFVKEIMGDSFGRKADLVVFTGATYDLAADPLTVAGYIEGYDTADLPDVASWESMRYFYRHDAAPNSIVYKYVSGGAIREARDTVTLAKSLVPNLEKWQSEADAQLASEEKARDYINRLLQEGRTINPKDKYVLGKILLGLPKGTIYSHIPAEYHSQVGGLIGLSSDAEKLAQTYPDELDELDDVMKQLGEDTRSGVIPEARQQVGSYNVPKDERRIALMKVLYPDYIKSLFHEDGSPKEVVFYDNVSISGEKSAGYLQFFQNLGIAEHVRLYIMYTRPGAKHDLPYTQTRVEVGAEINDGFVKRSVDLADEAAFTGREHDRKTKYAIPQEQFGENKDETAEERTVRLAELKRKQILAITEQMLLPNQVDELTHMMSRWARLSEGSDKRYSEMVVEFLNSGDQFPRIIAPSYTDYEPNEYADFEKKMGWEVSAEKKRYYQVARQALESIATQFQESHRQNLEILTLDSELVIVIESLLRHPNFAELRGKIQITDALTMRGKADKKQLEKSEDTYTVCIGRGFPTYQVDYINALDRSEYSIESIVLLGDGRKEYTDESRLDTLKKFQSDIADEATRAGKSLQNAEGYTPDEVVATIQKRVSQHRQLVPISEYSIDEFRAVLSTGADALNEHIRSANIKLNELGWTDEFFQTKEYLDYEKDISDIIRWSINLHREVVEATEAIAQATEATTLEFWKKTLTTYQELFKKMQTISTLSDLLRNLGVGDRLGSRRYSDPSTDVIQAVSDLVNTQYAIERGVTKINDILTAKYAETYLPEDRAGLHVQTTETMPYMITPRLYKSDLNEPNKLVTRSTEVAKSVEAMRYMSEVVAFQDEI